jgi:hypothetical protein
MGTLSRSGTWDAFLPRFRLRWCFPVSFPVHQRPQRRNSTGAPTYKGGHTVAATDRALKPSMPVHHGSLWCRCRDEGLCHSRDIDDWGSVVDARARGVGCPPPHGLEMKVVINKKTKHHFWGIIAFTQRVLLLPEFLLLWLGIYDYKIILDHRRWAALSRDVKYY